MGRILPAQIRAARALLDWSMLDLANKASVSVSTVKRFEDYQGAPASIALIQNALESEGIIFLDDDGNGPGVRYTARQDFTKAQLSEETDSLSRLGALTARAGRM